MSSVVPPYLQNLTVLELAGLAPGPLCGQMFADYGARVIRIDRTPSPSGLENLDTLTRGKQSLALNLKVKKGKKILEALLAHQDVDVLIDTYRPGVLERLIDLDAVAAARVHVETPLVVVRLTGYGQDSSLAGHDINYVAKAGILSALGTEGAPPAPPINVLGDFAALALPAFSAVLVALYGHSTKNEFKCHNKNNNRNQKVIQIDVNIVESLRYLAQFVSFAQYSETAMYRVNAPRGQNILDGQACPFYTVYETADPGKYLSVGALEPQFYDSFLDFLGFKQLQPAVKFNADDTDSGNKSNQATSDSFIQGMANILPDRFDRGNWQVLRALFQHRLKQQPLEYWAARAELFPDACVMPVEPLATPNQIPDAIVTGFSDGSKINKTLRSVPTPITKGITLKPGTHSHAVLSEFLGPAWNDEYGSRDYVYQHKLSKL